MVRFTGRPEASSTSTTTGVSAGTVTLRLLTGDAVAGAVAGAVAPDASALRSASPYTAMSPSTALAETPTVAMRAARAGDERRGVCRFDPVEAVVGAAASTGGTGGGGGT